LQSFLPRLSVEFTLVARGKRIQVVGEDFRLDRLFTTESCIGG
jgi:predicted nuclease of restriction endonuclease-like (RecB) superfamily